MHNNHNNYHKIAHSIIKYACGKFLTRDKIICQNPITVAQRAASEVGSLLVCSANPKRGTDSGKIISWSPGDYQRDSSLSVCQGSPDNASRKFNSPRARQGLPGDDVKFCRNTSIIR